jgi:hypothetical protein
MSGPYTVTVVDGGGHIKVGATQTWTFTPCGPDCTHYQTPGTGAADMHLQGDTWTGTQPGIRGETCTTTIDKNSLLSTQTCPSMTIVYQLAKGG